jgi:integrase/recombinase XerC
VIKEKLHRFKEEFLKQCEGMQGYSLLSIRSYAHALEEMINKAETVEEDGVITINLMPLRLEIASLKPKTISAKLSAIRSFVKYLKSEKHNILLRGDESIKVPKSLPKPVSHLHIVQVLSTAEPIEKLVITLLYTMGLRISELSHLKRSDVNERWCRVLGKGSKERDIPILPEVHTMMQEYQTIFPTKEYVFEEGGEKLSENSLRYILTKAFAHHGLKVTPHQLRHAYATELLNHGARISDVSELLGHKSMATTQIYTKLGNALKMENYLQSHPLCKTSKGS